MTFHILTLFPETFQGFRDASILGKAIEQGRIRLHLVNIRDFALDKHRSCDDYTYGGGSGMILKPEPLARALESVYRGTRRRTVYLTPSGRLFDQHYAEELAAEEELVLICGRYEGIDQRIIDLYVDEEISIGDYVLSGGETAAMVVVDALARLSSGMVKEDSLAEESFQQGLLEYPQYTRPKVFRGLSVPEVLLSGHHGEIKAWRLRKRVEKTGNVRPELLKRLEGGDLSPEMRGILEDTAEQGAADGQDKSN